MHLALVPGPAVERGVAGRHVPHAAVVRELEEAHERPRLAGRPPAAVLAVAGSEGRFHRSGVVTDHHVFAERELADRVRVHVREAPERRVPRRVRGPTQANVGDCDRRATRLAHQIQTQGLPVARELADVPADERRRPRTGPRLVALHGTAHDELDVRPRTAPFHEERELRSVRTERGRPNPRPSSGGVPRFEAARLRDRQHPVVTAERHAGLGSRGRLGRRLVARRLRVVAVLIDPAVGGLVERPRRRRAPHDQRRGRRRARRRRGELRDWVFTQATATAPHATRSRARSEEVVKARDHAEGMRSLR